MNRSALSRNLAGVVLAVVVLAACGGDDDDVGADTTTTDTTTTTEATTTSTTSAEDSEAAISEVTTEFFRLLGTGDRDGAIRLLENGDDYVDELVHCESLVAGVTVQMQSVELSGDTASTLYDIQINGETVLEGSGGTAVLVDGEWLVGENTFLSLYDAAKDGCEGPPPPADS